MAHASRRESGRNLPNGEFEARDIDLARQSLFNLLNGRRLEEQLQRLHQIASGFFYRLSLLAMSSSGQSAENRSPSRSMIAVTWTLCCM